MEYNEEHIEKLVHGIRLPRGSLVCLYLAREVAAERILYRLHVGLVSTKSCMVLITPPISVISLCARTTAPTVFSLYIRY